MTEFLADGQTPWIVLFLAFGAMALWELAAPLRPIETASVRRRWPANGGLLLASILTTLIVAPPTAWVVASAGVPAWAPLPALGVPGWLAVVVVILVRDAVQYGFHVAMHKVPVLWRIHRAHHTDVEFDVSTGLRFHPFEHALGLVVTAAVTWILGAPPEAIVASEAVRVLSNLVGHGNVVLPRRLEKLARLLLVTPSVHRIHHSAWQPETDSNYGNVLTLWDRMFGTFRDATRTPEREMTIGLEAFRSARDSTLPALLMLPFRRAGDAWPPLRA